MLSTTSDIQSCCAAESQNKADEDSPVSSTCRIMVVDDHPVVRLGLVGAINAEEDMNVCCQAGLLAEVMWGLKENPDVIVLDLSLQDCDGLDFLKNLQAQGVLPHTLVLSVHKEELYAERCLVAGARGYLMKSAPLSDVVAAIRRVHAGEIVISQQMQAQIVRNLAAAGGRNATARATLDKLSDRELTIFEMLGRGLSSKDIASALKISACTVDTHRRRIMTKMNCHSAHELVHLATVREASSKTA